MMSLNIADFVSSSPLMAVTATALLLILVEASRKGRPGLSFTLSMAGLFAASVFAVVNYSDEQIVFFGMLRQGWYANFLNLVFLSAAMLTVLVSKPYLERQGAHRGEYYILILFATIGMMFMAGANDLIVVFLGIELMSLCLYVLAGFFRTKDTSNESALKYFLLGAFATGFLLYGITLIYGTAGTTNLEAISKNLPTLSSQWMFMVGVGLLLTAFAFKVAAVPFHMWAPDVYEGAPTTVTAFMSTGAKAAAFATFVLLFHQVFQFTGSKVNDLIAYIAAASMVLGNVIAIAQANIKRMLAYSSIAHAGYMLSGIAAGNSEGQTGILFYLVAYTLMNVGAFGIVGLMEKVDDQNLQLDDYTGLSQQRPFLAALMAIFMFSLAGVPPFAGFFGKYYVFLSAVKADMTWLAVVGVMTSLVSAYYYLRIVVLMYFRDGKGDVAAQPAIPALVAVTSSAILLLQFGIFPSFIVNAVQKLF
ncbi:MAG: NADH-quinone oxidoreductase subunit N [Ignavibacteriales bacterium]|nr:NADH-quinone oxidoreductase subunit N [Ignavibacteriales bacterium]